MMQGTFREEVRYAFRMFFKTPGFTLIGVLTLALGIGATVAVFSLVNVVLLRPLPFKDADRLVMLWTTRPGQRADGAPVTPADFDDWKALSRSFESIASSSDSAYTLTGRGQPEEIFAYDYSSDFFSVLGVQPILGRTFRSDEARPGHNRVVVLGYNLWQRKFGSDRNIIGQSITLNGSPYTVIGVMPPGFAHPQITEMWAPLVLPGDLTGSREFGVLRIMARLKPGVTVEQAQNEMNQIATRLKKMHPNTNANRAVLVERLRDTYAGNIRAPLLILFTAVAFLLIIACANLANLLMVRTAGRQKELAIRAAMGARRADLVRQFLTESVLLSLIAGAVGLLLAYWTMNLLVAIFPNNIANLNIPQVKDIPLDFRVVLFTAAISLGTGILFGAGPAFQVGKTELNEVLKETGSSMAGSLRGRAFRHALVVTEVALAVVMMIGALLLFRSFLQLNRGDFGFNPHNVLTLQVLLPLETYKEHPKRLQFAEQVLERFRRTPGVQSAGATNFLPLTGFWGTVPVFVEGRPAPKPGEELLADYRVATTGYFESMKIRLLRGRAFTERDRRDKPQIVIINQTLAKFLFGNQDPIGKRLSVDDGENPTLCEIVGIVNDVKSFGLDQDTHNEIFRPYGQVPFRLIAFTARTTVEPASLGTTLEKHIWAVDPLQGIFKTISMEQLAAESTTLRRMSMQLLTAMAILALLLACIGIYAVIAYSVTLRTHEIGIRMAIGANRPSVFRMVLGNGMMLAAIGIGCGVAGALALTRLMSSLLFGVRPTDPLSFLFTALLLACVAAAACYLPARRATNVDPMIALRYE